MDYKKVGRGLAIALGGAALTYFAQLIPHIDFGTYTPVAVAVFSALINAGREYIKTL